MNQPLRILQVLTIMNRGGAETMIMNYYRNVDKTKVQFDFLLHRYEEGFFDEEIKSLGGKIYRMPAISPKNYFRYKKALFQFFEEHPEYKIVHSHLNALSSIILQVAKSKKIPVRIAHSHLAVEPFVLKKIFVPDTDIIATVKDSIQSLIRRRTRKYANHYFACGSKAGIWLYGKKNMDKVTIINNAIDSAKFTFNKKTREKVRSHLQIPEGTKLIGHIGRFNEQKNHFFLIEIFRELVKLEPSAQLILIGDGNLRPKIESLTTKYSLRDKVHFLGLRNDIPDLLQAIDYLLFPSLYEGLPLTLIEAQAAGLKIIASSTIAKEVDLTGQITFTSLNKPAESWAQLMADDLEYPRNNTHKLIVTGNYDIASNAKKLQQLYQKLL